MQQLLKQLSDRNIRLEVNDQDQLLVNAPAGAITTELADSIRRNKPALVTMLRKSRSVEQQEPLPQIVPDHAARYERFALNPVQHAYWIGRNSQLELGGVATHFYFETICEDIDLARLERAFSKVVRTHDMLRAVIDTDGQQRILKQVPEYRIATTDLSAESAAGVARALAEIRARMSHQVFDCEKWPLFEIRAARLSENKCILFYSWDFLVVDAWSMVMIFRQWREFYDNTELTEPVLGVSFRDYVLAENQIKNSASYRQSRQYWLDRIDTIPLAPRLPIKSKSETGRKYTFTRRRVRFPAEKWRSLAQRAQAQAITPTNLLLAAFSEVLDRWSKSQHYSLNLTLFNRLPLHDQVMDLVGDFTTLMVTEIGKERPATFVERAKLIQRNSLQDFAHRQFNGVEVLREIAKRRNLGRRAIMPVVFTSTLMLKQGGTQDSNGRGLEQFGALSYGISQTPQVLLDCQIFEVGGELVINWDAVEDMFLPGVLDAMFESQTRLLDKLAFEEAAWRADELVSLVPQQQWIREQDARSRHMSPLRDEEERLHSAFLEQAKAHPERTAVINDDITMSYGELLAHSSWVAEQLLDKGVQRNELVAVVMEKGWQQVVAVLGVLISGAAYLPIDPSLPEKRREYLLQQGEVRWMLISDSRRERLAGNTDVGVLEVTRLSNWTVPEALPAMRQSQRDIAYVIFTSGSSGVPKGVIIDHRGALNTVVAMNNLFNVQSSDRVLALSSLSFDLSVYDVFGLLRAGGTIVLPRDSAAKDPGQWSKLIDKHRVTLWNSVPQLMGMLVDYCEIQRGSDLSSIRTVWLSGDWIPVKLPARIRKLIGSCQVVSLGGATEGSIWSIYHIVDDGLPEMDSVPYGKALPGQSMMVLNEDLRLCPDSVTGSIYIGGEGLALGYWKDPRKTQRQFVVHPQTSERLYWTGDLGRYLSDGSIEFLGREDEQVKLNGHRVELGEICAHLKAYPHLEDAAVYVVESDSGQALAACVVPRKTPDTPLFQTITADPAQSAAEGLARMSDVSITQQQRDDLQYFSQFWSRLSMLCLAEMHRMIGQMKFHRNANTCEVIAEAGVLERYRFLVEKWLNVLQQANWIKRDGRGLLQSVAQNVVESPLSAADEQQFEQDERVGGFYRYVKQCLKSQWALLKGEISPLELLFPGGSLESAASLYQTNPVAGYHNRQIADVLREVLKQRPESSRLSILEVGAGLGATTEAVVGLLNPTTTEYWFTDISPFFLDNSRKKFEHIGFLHHELFNVDKDPGSQGYQSHSMDVIIAAHVIHNAKHVGDALENLRQLLKPGGTLIMLEGTEDSPWQWVSVAYLENIGDYPDLRAENKSPVLSIPQWRNVLEGAGFGAIEFYPHAENADPVLSCVRYAMPQHVILAQGPHRISRFDSRPLTEYLGALLPGYMVPQRFLEMSALPLNANGKVDRSALPRHRRTALSRDVRVAPAKGGTEHTIYSIWKEVLKIESISVDDNFFDIGGDSLLLTQALARMGQSIAVRLTMADLFTYPTIRSLSDFISQSSQTGIKELLARAAKPRQVRDNRDVAIIGMAGRFADADNVDALWENLRLGVCSVRYWDDATLRAAGVEESLLKNPAYVKAGVVVEHMDLFDARYFGFAPSEARIMDPQIRLLLEEAVIAMEHAGYPNEKYARNIGVFVGKDTSQYLYAHLFGRPELMRSMGVMAVANVNEKDYVATQISYKLGFTGPSLNILTACSTSLVVIHQACQSLLNGECNVALAGGVSLETAQPKGYLYQEGSTVSPDGMCRAFSSDANGGVRGSGVGLVVLKRLDEALADRDTIHGVIKGSAINNDGALKIGFTAPSVQGQARVLAAALDAAGLAPSDIQYVEAHGTGTALGDPIEVKALSQIYNRAANASCAIGSIKTNMGHLDVAAGVAGLIKTVLAIKHGKIPPSLHFKAPNPRIDFADGALYVNHSLSDWPGAPAVRRAGVSSFGVGGTNAHVIVEQAPPAPTQTGRHENTYHLVPLSARTPESLQQLTRKLADWAGRNPDANLADVAYTHQVGRNAHDYRRIVVCKSLDQLRASLQGEQPVASLVAELTPSVIFMFPGQGTQQLEATWQVYQRYPVFRRYMDQCATLLDSYLAMDIRAILYSDYASQNGIPPADPGLIKQTGWVQPVLFAVEYSLAQLWLSFGVRPEGMIGHSLGEYVAACLSGVFSLEEALSLVAVRGQLMQAMEPGRMLAVRLSESELTPLLVGSNCELATINGPLQTVVSGTAAAIEGLGKRLEAQGVLSTLLKSSHAFHSSMMEPMLATFESCVREAKRNPVSIPFVSNVTGRWITDAQAQDPAYWAKQIRQAVRFSDGLATLFQLKQRRYLEVGPGSVLSDLAIANGLRRNLAIPTLGRNSREVDETYELSNSLGQLWLNGVEIDWPSLHGESRPGRIPLPTYPFDRQSYWLPPTKLTQEERSDVFEALVEADDSVAAQEAVKTCFPRPVLQSEYVEPRGELQLRMTELWQNVLGLEKIGINDNFFELGGSSLLGVQINEQMKRLFTVDIPMDKLFQLATVRNIVNYYEILTESRALSDLSDDEVTDILRVYET